VRDATAVLREAERSDSAWDGVNLIRRVAGPIMDTLHGGGVRRLGKAVNDPRLGIGPGVLETTLSSAWIARGRLSGHRDRADRVRALRYKVDLVRHRICQAGQGSDPAVRPDLCGLRPSSGVTATHKLFVVCAHGVVTYRR
jgi:hypothetical protein